MEENRNVEGRGARTSNQPPPPPPGDSSLYCQFCNAKYDSSVALVEHMTSHKELIEAEVTMGMPGTSFLDGIGGSNMQFQGSGSSHQTPLGSYYQASSSSSRSLPHPGNQAYGYEVGESTLPSTTSNSFCTFSLTMLHRLQQTPVMPPQGLDPRIQSLMAHQGISGSSPQPSLSYSVGNYGQESINTSILSQAPNTPMHQFQSLVDRPVTVQEGLSSLSLPNWNIGQEGSFSTTPQLFNVNERQFDQQISNSARLNNARHLANLRALQLLWGQQNTGSSHQPLDSHPSQNFGQEITNSSILHQTQNIVMPRVLLLIAQGSTRSSHQHLVSCLPQNFGQESSSNSSRRPQNESIQRQFCQESSNDASTLPQTQRISMREFQSSMDQGISGSSHQPLFSNPAVLVRVQDPNGNFGQQSSNNASTLPQPQRVSRSEFERLMDRQSRRSSGQPSLSNSAVPVRVQGLPSSRSNPIGNFGQESRISSIRPQSASIARCNKRRFSQESGPADSNVERRSKSPCDERKFDQAGSSSVIVPQNSITEGEGPLSDLNVTPSSPENGAQEQDKFHWNSKP